jgi:hypothetical protein
MSGVFDQAAAKFPSVLNSIRLIAEEWAMGRKRSVTVKPADDNDKRAIYYIVYIYVDGITTPATYQVCFTQNIGTVWESYTVLLKNPQGRPAHAGNWMSITGEKFAESLRRYLEELVLMDEQKEFDRLINMEFQARMDAFTRVFKPMSDKYSLVLEPDRPGVVIKTKPGNEQWKSIRVMLGDKAVPFAVEFRTTEGLSNNPSTTCFSDIQEIINFIWGIPNGNQ